MDIKELAIIGARTRINDLGTEIGEMQKELDELNRFVEQAESPQRGKRGRRPLTDREKARLSRKMKAYWAKRRGEA